VNIKAFYQESIVAARSLHADWTIFDNDSDGVIDMVYFIYAGEGQNGSDDAYTIWPKEQGSGGTINGVKYGSYGCSNEIYNGSVDGIGTICHELSHALGLPDLYDTNYVAFGMDYWDVMDSGCYCANGKCPCGYSAYEKDFMGWNKLVELSPNNPQTLTLQPLSEGGGGYKIVSKDNPDEYYVLDNRQNTKWDTYAGYSTDKYGKAHGLLVTHVDYLQSSWTSNRVNTNKTHQRVTLIPADGQLLIRNASNAMEYLSSMQGDPYPGIMGVTSLEGERAVLYSGGCMNQPITNIVENADGTVTFDYCVNDSANAIGGQYFIGEAFEIVERGVKAYCDIEVFDVSGLLRYRMEPDEYIELDKGIYLLRFKNGVQKIAIH
jgi:M6 family metalloprotease-like protein